MAQINSFVFSIGCALAISLSGGLLLAKAETPVVEIRGASGESVSSPAPAGSSVPTAAASATGPGRYGPLTSRDTLWSIAERVRPGERGTIYQTIIAIYDNNPGAFENGNINTLKPGAFIDLPTEADVRAVDRRTAVSRFTQLSTGKPVRQPARSPAAVKAEAPTAVTKPAPQSLPAKTPPAAAKPAEAAPATLAEPLKPATGLKNQAEQQQLSELQAALATEREQLARLRSELDAKQNEISLLREQIGRDEALQQQVADLMRANRELEELRKLHQQGLSDRPWYQPLGESTTLLSLFLGLPTLLLLALLWALLLRKPQVVEVSPSEDRESQVVDLAKEEANLEGGGSQAVNLPSSVVDLTSEVEAALALDDLDDLLLPENGKKAAAPAGNLLARDDSLDLGDMGTTIDLSGGDDSLPDLDDLLGDGKSAAAKSAAPASAASADDELNLDDLDSLLASFDAEKKPGKAEPEPAAPVQDRDSGNSDAILSDDDLLAALSEDAADNDGPVSDDGMAAIRAATPAASTALEEAQETSLEQMIDLDSGATASQAEAEELDLEQLSELELEQPVLAETPVAEERAADEEFDLEALTAEPATTAALDLAAVAAEDEFDLEALTAEPATIAALDLTEVAAEDEFDLEALTAEPATTAALDLAEVAAEDEFDLEALTAEPATTAALDLAEVAAEDEFDLEALTAEQAIDGVPDLVAQPDDDLLETTLASGTRVTDDDLDLDLSQFEGVTADELLRQLEQAGDSELLTLELEAEPGSESASSPQPEGSAAPASSGELLDVDDLGSFTEADAEKFNDERQELQFDGVADFTEESLQAAAKRADVNERASAASDQERSLEDALAALGSADEDEESFALELDDDEIAANLAALGLDEPLPNARAALDQAKEDTLEPELDAADTASRNQQLLAELAALGGIDGDLAVSLADVGGSAEVATEADLDVVSEQGIEVELNSDTAHRLPPASPVAPEWGLSPVGGVDAPVSAAEETGESSGDAGSTDAREVVVSAADLADDQLSVAGATPPVAAFDIQTEQALASLDQPVSRRTPLFVSDHSESDRLGDALPPGFQGQSKVQSAFHGFEELLPEVNHIDVDADNGCNAKLDLARAYIEIDDLDGARDILDDVLADGSVDQRLEAQRLLLLLQRSL